MGDGMECGSILCTYLGRGEEEGRRKAWVWSRHRPAASSSVAERVTRIVYRDCVWWCVWCAVVVRRGSVFHWMHRWSDVVEARHTPPLAPRTATPTHTPPIQPPQQSKEDSARPMPHTTSPHVHNEGQQPHDEVVGWMEARIAQTV